MHHVWILGLILCLVDPLIVQAATPSERESLEGLPGVRVLLDDILPEAQKEGLSPDDIRTSVELILRSSGIRILSQAELANTVSRPMLMIAITAIRRDETYGINVAVELFQKVSLVTVPRTMHAVTWHESTVGSGGSRLMKEWVMNEVESFTKAFANDYLTVNPR